MSVKVLVVDDSLFMRKLVSDIINKDDELKLVGVAKNGQEAIDLNKKLEPDVILLDVEMPVVDGIQALSTIMADRKCAVIMFSSTTSKGAENTLRALELGACDFITKPTTFIYKLEDEMVEELLTKLKYVKCVDGAKRNEVPPKTKKKLNVGKEKQEGSSIGSKTFKKLVAIGLSTGGPRALQEVLEDLPGNLNAPVVVVQHMPKLFTKAFADRLDANCRLEVKEAEDGDVLRAGVVYIAPGDKHLRVKKSFNDLKISLDEGPKVSGHRPSVDAMFDSLSELSNVDIVAVIMTGMGRDGADGMLKLKNKGAKTVGQDEATSIVYGMPKSAFEIGAVETVCPLGKIAEQIISLVEV